jgi:hypothetical protein
MKQIIIFSTCLACLLLLHLKGFAQTPNNLKKIEVERYVHKSAKEFQFIKIATSFGNSKFSNFSELDSLKNKKIVAVRLVYTRYRESETFNQEQLNNKRFEQLVASNPGLFSSPKIKWYLIEQTLIDSSVAKELFHGFYIVYQNKLPERDYALGSTILNEQILPIQTFKIDNKKQLSIQGKEGTQILVQAKSFLDENNQPYLGEVHLELKEATTMESMVLGNLVTLSDGNALESGGMIYINAKSTTGKNLKLNPKKPMEVTVNSKGKSKPDMQLWSAEQKGSFINWKNPVALNDKVPVDKANNKTNNQIPTKTKEIEDYIILPEDNNNQAALNEIQLRLSSAFIESLRISNFNKSNIDDYYMLMGNGQIRVIIFKTIGVKNEIILADTTYDGTIFHNSKKPLPLPVIAKRKDFDSVFYQNNHLVWGGTKNIPIPDNSTPFYSFNYMELGQWSNIDRLASDKRTQDVEFFASLPEDTKYSDLSIFLVFKNENIFIPGYRSNKFKGYGFSHGDHETPKLPVGAQAFVLCLCKKDNRQFVDIKPVIISKKQQVKLYPTPSSDAEIKALIANTF